MKFTTEQQKKAAKTILRITSQTKIGKRQIIDMLTKDETKVYSSRGDAKNFVKEAVQSDSFPLEDNGGSIVRTDIAEGEVAN